MNQAKLLSKRLKKIEQELVVFYRTIGKMIDLNPKRTEIFAYLKIYDTLTQAQLKQLTGLSLGTISTTLHLFLQTNIVTREMIPGTHKNLYKIKSKKASFIYTPFKLLVEDLEKLDSNIIELQKQLQEKDGKYPLETKFLNLRLNGFRNYIEVQRRQFSGKQKYSFFQEDVSTILPLNQKIVYPFGTEDIDRILMDFYGYYRFDPIRNRLLNLLYLYRSLDQQALMDLSGVSRSSVSRFLRNPLNKEYVKKLPREYRRPRIYYLESISLSTLATILNTDNFIFASIPRFQEILSTLQSDRKDTAFLIPRIEEIIEHIAIFEKRTIGIRKAYKDLSKFLRKDSM
ncbi:MAG: hypothetical protein ACFFEV_04295 [Candidatus Thorarchaeota archaeon]